MEKCLISDTISCCLNSVSQCNLLQLSKFILRRSLKTAHDYCIISFLINLSNNLTCNHNPKKEEDQQECYHHHHHQRHHYQESEQSNCERQETEDELSTYNDIDIDTVMSNLGVDEWQNVHKQNDELLREAHEFLDSKNGSLEELKEAFYVFDRNEDGFITAFELWSVLRRLEMKEGMRYEDCEEMIRVYDKNSDGRISFDEFKDMMEQAL